MRRYPQDFNKFCRLIIRLVTGPVYLKKVFGESMMPKNLKEHLELRKHE